MSVLRAPRFTAWNNDASVAATVRARIAAHKAMDQIIQGDGWLPEKNQGCAIGCSLDEYSCGNYALVLGIELRVAFLVDVIHENLSARDSVNWPGRVAHALVPGADTTLVADRWFLWLLTEELGAYATSQPVADLYRRRCSGDEPLSEEWAVAAERATNGQFAAIAAVQAAMGAQNTFGVINAAQATSAHAERIVAEGAVPNRSTCQDRRRACFTRMADALIQAFAFGRGEGHEGL